METFRQILKAAADAGASDIHLKVGGPVMFRVHRNLVPVDAPAPTAAWIASVLQQVVPGPLIERLEQEHEVDLAFELEGAGVFAPTFISSAAAMPCAPSCENGDPEL